MLDEYVQDNYLYYARFDTHNYHRFREKIHFNANAKLDMNNARLNVKPRPKSLEHEL